MQKDSYTWGGKRWESSREDKREKNEERKEGERENSELGYNIVKVF